LVKVERSVSTFVNEKSVDKIIASSNGNQLIINNQDVQQNANLYAINGKLIKTLRINNGYNQFDLNKGVYIFKTLNGRILKVII